MKILYLHPRSWTGEYPILVKLRELGHTICVLEEDSRLSTSNKITPDFEKYGDHIETYWYNPHRGLRKIITWAVDRYFKRAFGGRNLVHRIWTVLSADSYFKPDVIITSDGFTYAAPAAIARRFKLLSTPVISSFIGGDILDCPEADNGRRRTKKTGWLITQVVNHLDLLRPVSPKLRQVLLTDGALSTKIHVVPSHLVANMHMLTAIHSDRSDVSRLVRQSHNIPIDSPLFITLSSNQKGKGIHIFAKIWDTILKQFPSAHWLLCGPQTTWLENKIWPEIEKNNIEDTVTITGSLAGKEVFQHLASADILINPTLCEGLNMVTVEAAAVGTPSICADGAGITAWISSYNSGVVVPANESQPLADAIIYLLNNSNKLNSMRRNCIEMADEFTLDNVATQLVGLFKETIRDR